jgi:hypothetical protein
MSAKLKLYHDSRISQPNETEMFLHCQQCLGELPRGESPMEWARLSVGITAAGAIQVWCVRHGGNVDIIGSPPRPGIKYPAQPQPIECACCGNEVRT